VRYPRQGTKAPGRGCWSRFATRFGEAWDTSSDFAPRALSSLRFGQTHGLGSQMHCFGMGV
jgi:hypothetical protein